MIPVYAGLRAQNRHDEADRAVRIVGTLLFCLVSLLCAIGIWISPWLIDVIAPGFQGEKAALTVRLVQIFFPGISLLVMSAWCLGVLNTHKKFFLSYVAPVVSNLAIIATLIFWGGRSDQNHLAIICGWGLVAGSFLQLAVQIPSTAKLLLSSRMEINTQLEAVRVVFKNFFPVVLSRGVVQLSAYIDSIIASYLPTGAVTALAYAQTIYLLPVSLFGMSVAAAELPAMSEATGDHHEINAFLSKRLCAGLEQIAFFVVPSVVVFIFFGDLTVGAIYESGHFAHADTIYVWGVLAGAAVGLLAGTQGRLYASAFYSMKDTRTPIKFACIRVAITTVLGYFFALKLPQILGVEQRWGTAGLTVSAGLAAWVEFLLLRSALEHRIGRARLEIPRVLKLWACALIALAVAGPVSRWVVPNLHIILRAAITLGIFGVIYVGSGLYFNVPQASSFLRRFSKKKQL